MTNRDRLDEAVKEPRSVRIGDARVETKWHTVEAIRAALRDHRQTVCRPENESQ